MGIAVGGWLMVLGMEASQRRAAEFPLLAARRLASTRYFARHLLVEAPGLADTICDGSTFIAETEIAHL
jgi:hypothetical protein